MTASGRFVSLPGPHGSSQGFVPSALPPELRYGEALVAAVARAEYAVGALSAMAQFMPNLDLLVEPFLVVEATLSARIEGTETTVEEVLRAEALAGARPSADTEEVRNYLRALRYGQEVLREGRRALDRSLICELHALLLAGVRGQERSPGSLREVTVWIGSGARTIDTASYVPPPWPQVPELLAEWESYLARCRQDAATLPGSRLLQCGLLHGQFELIHPFRDGNGRLGRLLMTLLLTTTGHLGRPTLFLSGFFEHHRQEYYGRLRAISRRSDWEGWLRFFLRAVQTQSERMGSAGRAVLALRRQWLERLRAAEAPGYVFSLLDRLFENPYTTAGRAEEQLQVTAPTAGKALGILMGMGLLEEVTGQKRNRQYRATEILRAVEAWGQGEGGYSW